MSGRAHRERIIALSEIDVTFHSAKLYRLVEVNFLLPSPLLSVLT